MRRRSNTILADSVEEYVEKASKEQMELPHKPPLQEPKKSPQKRPVPSRRRRFGKALSLLMDAIPEVEDFADYDSDNETESDATSSSQNRSPATFPLLFATESSTSVEESSTSYSEVSQVHKIMVTGAHETGRHTLIETLFGRDLTQSTTDSESINSITRSRKLSETAQEDFTFWIRNPLEQEDHINVRSIQKHIFVYNITESSTFLWLDTIIADTIKKVGKENFEGFLVGTFSDQETEREISFEDGLKLKKKYNLKEFTETNKYDVTLKFKFLKFLKYSS